MKIKVEIDLNEEQIACLKRLCAMRGVQRERPNKAWTQTEVKQICKIAIGHIVSDFLTKEICEVPCTALVSSK